MRQLLGVTRSSGCYVLVRVRVSASGEYQVDSRALRRRDRSNAIALRTEDDFESGAKAFGWRPGSDESARAMLEFAVSTHIVTDDPGFFDPE